MKDLKQLAQNIYDGCCDVGAPMSALHMKAIKEVLNDHFKPSADLEEMAIKILCQEYESNEDELQLHITLNPDKNRIIKAMIQFAQRLRLCGRFNAV